MNTNYLENDEVARIKIGPPGINADIPIRRSFLSKMSAPFRKPAVETLIMVQSSRVVVFASNASNGSVEWRLSVVNMGDCNIVVDATFVNRISAGGYDLPAMAT